MKSLPLPVEAAVTTPGWVVGFRWKRWLLQVGLEMAGAACGLAGMLVFWRLRDLPLAAAFGLLPMMALVAFLVSLNTGLPAARTGHFLRMDSHGLFHFGRGYIPWSQVAAVDGMRQMSLQSWKWRRNGHDHFLVVTLAPTVLSGRQPGTLQYLGSPYVAFSERAGRVVLPLEYAADEPRAVLAAVRAIAARAGVAVPTSAEITPVDEGQRPLTDRRRLLPQAAVALVCIFVVFLLARGMV